MVMMGVSEPGRLDSFYLDKLSFSIANRSQEFGFSPTGTVNPRAA